MKNELPKASTSNLIQKLNSIKHPPKLRSSPDTKDCIAVQLNRRTTVYFRKDGKEQEKIKAFIESYNMKKSYEKD